MCSHELFSLDLTQQMQPHALLAVQITPQETFSRFLCLQLWDFSVMLMERILMTPDAAKFIIGNAESRHGPRIAGGELSPQKSCKAVEMTAEWCLEALPSQRFWEGGGWKPAPQLESHHLRVRDLKGTKNIHLHSEMKRISLSTWDSFAWIRFILRLGDLMYMAPYVLCACPPIRVNRDRGHTSIT